MSSPVAYRGNLARSVPAVRDEPACNPSVDGLMCHTLRALTDRRQIGVVMKLDGNPDVEHRVQVSVPVMQAETEGVWARRLQFHGSSGFGAFHNHGCH